MGIAEFIVPAGSFFRLFLPFGEYGLLEKNERDQSLQKLDPREIESQELTRKQAVFTNLILVVKSILMLGIQRFQAQSERRF